MTAGASPRQPTLDALAGVNDATWYVLINSVQGINRVLADTAIDNPLPNMELDAAITAELTRMTGR